MLDENCNKEDICSLCKYGDYGEENGYYVCPFCEECSEFTLYGRKNYIKCNTCKNKGLESGSWPCDECKQRFVKLKNTVLKEEYLNKKDYWEKRG